MASWRQQALIEAPVEVVWGWWATPSVIRTGPALGQSLEGLREAVARARAAG